MRELQKIRILSLWRRWIGNGLFIQNSFTRFQTSLGTISFRIIMATLSLTIFAGMSAVWTGMEESNQDYFNKTNLCDGWVLGSNITTDDIKDIEALSCINSAACSMLFSTNQVSDNTNSDIRLVTFNTDTRKVMNPILRNGEKMEVTTDGIWIDEDYAMHHHLQPGDIIKLEIPSLSALLGKKYEVNLTIVGNSSFGIYLFRYIRW